ncbi:5193_t:CDS:2 [Paraglomus brasilianum]|uniref:5193_t:CDS:1 n=1 Tax=Paraglomus brasilianum TaxID=144538 RepID=A0A9N9BLP4_9GLOM|nr:5193_t:CDS:2 [Paraglomus brasilianum]
MSLKDTIRIALKWGRFSPIRVHNTNGDSSIDMIVEHARYEFIIRCKDRSADESDVHKVEDILARRADDNEYIVGVLAARSFSEKAKYRAFASRYNVILANEDDIAWKIKAPAYGITHPEDSEIATLRRCISYSAVSYCENNNDLDNWNCGKHCNNAPGTEFVQAFSARRTFYQVEFLGDNYGYIAVNHKFQEIVVAFRGTTNLLNIAEDLNTMESVFQAEGVQYEGESISQAVRNYTHVHKGFYDAWKSLKDDINDKLNTLINQYQGYSVVVTGHSLGGAMAVFQAVNIKETYPEIMPRLYTYNAPRVGNEYFAYYVNNVLDWMRRVVVETEPVSHFLSGPMITKTLETYTWKHHKGEVWIANHTQEKEGTFVCAGSENEFCSHSLQPRDFLTSLHDSIKDHSGPFFWDIMTSKDWHGCKNFSKYEHIDT